MYYTSLSLSLSLFLSLSPPPPPSQELSDALMDAKLAIEDVKSCSTLRQVLGTLLAIGNFLNSREVSSVCAVHRSNRLEG